MTRKLTPAQLDEIEAAARSEITARVTPPSIDQVGRVRREWETFLKAATPINVLALIYDLREADAAIERVREILSGPDYAEAQLALVDEAIGEEA